MKAILETKNLTHIYSPKTPFERVALNAVNFTAYEGEYLGIIGHTGSGKSTLMQHLNGLLQGSQGEVLFQGKNIFSDPSYTRDTRFQVGLVFQYPEYQLFEETVAKDIAFGPKNMGLAPEEIQERVRKAAEFVNLPLSVMEKSPFELSGGQKRRVAIAGVIAMEPKVLILDEPTAGLDPVGAKEILDNIKSYQQAHNATIILVSHSMEDVAEIAQRILVIEAGTIPLQGTVAEVFSHGEELEAMGLALPQMTRIFRKLKEKGLLVDDNIYTLEQGKEAILSLIEGRKSWH
ncbi:MAG: energy-coupling factor transporter ATPase [Eubacteriales bacterium]